MHDQYQRQSFNMGDYKCSITGQLIGDQMIFLLNLSNNLTSNLSLDLTYVFHFRQTIRSFICKIKYNNLKLITLIQTLDNSHNQENNIGQNKKIEDICQEGKKTGKKKYI